MKSYIKPHNSKVYPQIKLSTPFTSLQVTKAKRSKHNVLYQFLPPSPSNPPPPKKPKKKKLQWMTIICIKVYNNNPNHKAKQQVPEVDEDTPKIEGSWYVCDWMWYEKRKPKKNLQNHSQNTRRGLITLNTQCPLPQHQVAAAAQLT